MTQGVLKNEVKTRFLLCSFVWFYLDPYGWVGVVAWCGATEHKVNPQLNCPPSQSVCLFSILHFQCRLVINTVHDQHRDIHPLHLRPTKVQERQWASRFIEGRKFSAHDSQTDGKSGNRLGVKFSWQSVWLRVPVNSVAPSLHQLFWIFSAVFLCTYPYKS